MNADQQQAAQDIIDNLKAVKGADFARVAIIALQVKGVIGMIATADMDDTHRAMMFEAVGSVIARMLSEIVSAHDLNAVEITEWADRLQERVGPHLH